MFSPKFTVTDYTELRYLTGYEVTKTKVDVKYILTEEGMRYDIESPAKKITAHILLPKGKSCKELLLNGVTTEFKIEYVGGSTYVDVNCSANGIVSFEILF